MMKFSILIPTITRHAVYLRLLQNELRSQRLKYHNDVQILVDYSESDNIGTKRNRLLQQADGKYLAFFDSDDFPGVNYIERIMEGINGDYDCCSLRGLYSINGVYDGIFEHSIKYDKWETVSGEIRYLRYPNHLNCIKSSIAKQFSFPEKNFGEDKEWSDKIFESKLIKTEYFIPDIIYYYRYLTDKTK